MLRDRAAWFARGARGSPGLGRPRPRRTIPASPSLATPYNHYSLLRTIEWAWDLGYLGYAADSANVSAMTPLLEH